MVFCPRILLSRGQEDGDRSDEDKRPTPIWTDYEAQTKIDVEMEARI
jgi:hypothetical protein